MTLKSDPRGSSPRDRNKHSVPEGARKGSGQSDGGYRRPARSDVTHDGPFDTRHPVIDALPIGVPPGGCYIARKIGSHEAYISDDDPSLGTGCATIYEIVEGPFAGARATRFYALEPDLTTAKGRKLDAEAQDDFLRENGAPPAFESWYAGHRKALDQAAREFPAECDSAAFKARVDELAGEAPKDNGERVITIRRRRVHGYLVAEITRVDYIPAELSARAALGPRPGARWSLTVEADFEHKAPPLQPEYGDPGFLVADDNSDEGTA